MSKGNMLLGYAKGKVGSMVFSRLRGQQITRAYNASPANPRSDSQQLQRTKLANLVNFYRRGRSLLNHSFTNRKENQSSYNAFVSRNIQNTTVHLTKSQASNAMSIVGPYVISDGVLPPIQINGGGVDAVTNIAVGELVIDDATTTIGQLSLAIIANNAEWAEGDQLTYVSVVQNGGVDGGVPFAQFSYFEMDLVASDSTLLRDVMPAYALTIRDGRIGHGQYVADGGYAWIHSRKSSTGALQASRQSLILTANTLYDVYISRNQTAAATLSYGASQDNILVPDGSRPGFGELAGMVISSVKINTTVLQSGNNAIGVNIAPAGNTPMFISGANFVFDDDAEASDVIAVSWTPVGGSAQSVDVTNLVVESLTSFRVGLDPETPINSNAYGTLKVVITNKGGISVEQSYTFTEPASGSGTAGNPL